MTDVRADSGLLLAASVRDSDAHRRAWIMRHGREFDVLLDGVPVTKVIGYDVEAGTVLRFQTNAAGRIVLLDGLRRGAAVETLSGRVEVRWRSGFPAPSPMETRP